jgi:hypothetical protein
LQFTLRTLLITIIVVAFVLAALALAWQVLGGRGSSEDKYTNYRITRPVDPLPDLAEIIGMSAKLTDFMGNLPVPKFEVPRTEWAAVRSALLPCEVDRHPTTYVMLGWLKMTLKTGSTISVELYFTGEVGAFSIDKHYYRGGSSPKLDAAIRRAYAVSTSDRQGRDGNPN